MAADRDPRDAELRERVHAILAANRELGGRFEAASVDQIMELMPGRRERPGRPSRRYVPRADEGAARNPWRPRAWGPLGFAVLFFVVIFGALPAMGALVGAAVGIATAFGWVVFGLACVVLIRLFRRTLRAIDGPMPWGWERRESRRSWRGGCGRSF